jgi:hypothetical protein
MVCAISRAASILRKAIKEGLSLTCMPMSTADWASPCERWCNGLLARVSMSLRGSTYESIQNIIARLQNVAGMTANDAKAVLAPRLNQLGGLSK